jgi:hypothetical protein
MITERQFAPNRFQHCSTISKGPPGAGTFLAYYTGDAEMHQSQHVKIHWFSEDGHEAEPVELGDYTGNPILFETPEGTRLIYSKFETLTPNRIEWWQHCSIWNSFLDIQWKHGKPNIVVGAPEQIIVDEPGPDPAPKGLGYVARCHPIIGPDGEYLLPLYREHAPHFHGTILQSKNGIDWEYHSTIGRGIRCIQPTIYVDKLGNICALLRKFSRGSNPYAYYSELDYDNKTWSKPIHSPYLNANNSILAVNYAGEAFIIWNNDPMGRDKISLCKDNTPNNKPFMITQFDGYGSYPSACVDTINNLLHIVYTAKPNPLKNPGVKSVIKWKQYNLEAILRAGRKDTSWSGFSQIYSPSQSSSSPWKVVPPKNSQSPGDQSPQ